MDWGRGSHLLAGDVTSHEGTNRAVPAGRILRRWAVQTSNSRSSGHEHRLQPQQDQSGRSQAWQAPGSRLGGGRGRSAGHVGAATCCSPRPFTSLGLAHAQLQCGRRNARATGESGHAERVRARGRDCLPPFPPDTRSFGSEPSHTTRGTAKKADGEEGGAASPSLLGREGPQSLSVTCGVAMTATALSCTASCPPC
jgi:hypothetical protein